MKMKKLLFTLLLICIVTISNAQWEISGSANFVYNSESTQININPYIGHKLTDNSFIGIQLGYGNNDDKVSYSIAPCFTYCTSLNDKLEFDIDFLIPYTHLNSNEHTIGVSINPYFQYYIKNNIGLLINLGGLNYIHNISNKNGELSLYIVTGIGVAYYF
jgi:hypothetical protein